MIFRSVEDGDLIRQAQKPSGPSGGSEAVEAFNLLVSRWEKRVYNYLLRLTANREDALDLTQEVFLKAYQNLRNLDDPGRFGPWLYRIAHNEAYSMFRKRKPEADPETPRSGEPPAAQSPSAEAPCSRLSWPGGYGGAKPPVAGAAGSRGPQDVPGLQVRGNGRDSLLPGVDREITALLRARSIEDRTGSNWNERRIMSCSPFDLRDYFLREMPAPASAPGGRACSSVPGRAARNWTVAAHRDRADGAARRRDSERIVRRRTMSRTRRAGGGRFGAFWNSARAPGIRFGVRAGHRHCCVRHGSALAARAGIGRPGAGCRVGFQHGCAAANPSGRR